jgi:hypothetical protein
VVLTSRKLALPLMFRPPTQGRQSCLPMARSTLHYRVTAGVAAEREMIRSHVLE